MVSRRNFISICIMMAVILALFQFSLLIRDFGNSYDTNDYLKGPSHVQTDSWGAGSFSSPVGSVAYIGGDETAMAGIVRQWGNYTKRQVTQYSTPAEYQNSGGDNSVLLCVAGSEIATEEDVSVLRALAEDGYSIVFCDLPDVEFMRRVSGIRTLLGIQDVVEDEVTLRGVKLFSGFLLGGEAIYRADTEQEQENQNLTLNVPWYLARSGTKTYMVGLLEDESVENESLPGLIWRNSYGNALVFAVNGDYMYEQAGIGILSGIMYELQSYELHPVVNAQSLSVVNFPNFALENSNELVGIYARNLRRLQMDLLWPNLIAASNKVNYLMTCFMTPRLDYTAQAELFPDDLSFYLRQFREQGSEAGLSLDYLKGTTLPEMVELDRGFFVESGSEYECGAAYVNSEDLGVLSGLLGKDPLERIITLTGVRDDDKPIISYFSDRVLDLGVTCDGFSHTYSQNLRVRALETALGYSNILLDMKHVSWPEEDEPHWELLYDAFSSNIDTYWKPFSAFDKTTISESDERARAFLAMEYAETREGDTIFIDISNRSSESWFLLRTHSETISDIAGGSYQTLEAGAYLVHATENHVEITLTSDNHQIYYIP